jgi:hypothetical protein
MQGLARAAKKKPVDLTPTKPTEPSRDSKSEKAVEDTSSKVSKLSLKDGKDKSGLGISSSKSSNGSPSLKKRSIEIDKYVRILNGTGC